MLSSVKAGSESGYLSSSLDNKNAKKPWKGFLKGGSP
jgi:hypothetical protein